MSKLTHLDEAGRARMVDVGDKDDTERVAVARGSVNMQPETLALIIEGNMKKGDVLTVAQLAGIMAAKRTSDLIPMCHPLMLSHVAVTCTPNPTEKPRRHRGVGPVEGQNRRGDGGVNGRFRCRTHHLRHGQSRRSRHGHWRRARGRKIGRQKWRLESWRQEIKSNLKSPDLLISFNKTMEIQIKLFATLKDKAGSNKITVSVAEPATVATLLEAVGAAYPALQPSLPIALVSVNKSFAGKDTAVSSQDEVAMFPPVSGGSGADDLPHPTYFAVTTEPLDIDAIHAQLTNPEIGAVVSFTGFVRGQTQRDGLPPETSYLEYEAYSEMAELKMAQVAREIWQKWPLVKGVAIVQRIGRLDIGENTTFVACASGHRDQGCFDAARYGIDRLKEIVPVWKKEVGEDAIRLGRR